MHLQEKTSSFCCIEEFKLFCEVHIERRAARAVYTTFQRQEPAVMERLHSACHLLARTVMVSVWDDETKYGWPLDWENRSQTSCCISRPLCYQVSEISPGTDHMTPGQKKKKTACCEWHDETASCWPGSATTVNSDSAHCKRTNPNWACVRFRAFSLKW